MKGDVIWHLEFRTLTPVHIGDGSTWGPGDYVIERPRKLEDWERDEMDDEEIEAFERNKGKPQLHLVSFVRVLLDAPPAQRRRIESDLDRGNWKGACETAAKLARPEHRLGTIDLLDEDIADMLEKTREDPRKYGELGGFVRSGGRPVIPGSSVKGALRTAWLAHLLNQRQDLAEELRAKIADISAKVAEGKLRRAETSGIASRMEALLLEEQERLIPDRDPFRYVSVPDVGLPDGSTTIWKVWNHVPATERPQRRWIDLQIFREFLRSWADTDKPATWQAEVRIEGPARQERRRSLAPSRTSVAPDPWELWDALRTFGLQLWDSEIRWFWNAEPEVRRMLERAEREFGFRENRSYALLRLGRFAHFESKSIPPLRANPHHRQPERLRSHGETRMVVRRSDKAIPLGWVLVWLREVRDG